MNLTVFSLRRPVTTLMVVVALMSGGVLALKRMQVDIFPSLNTPRIFVFLQYGGMSPEQMEGFVVCQFELLFQYVDGIKEIKSRCIQQIALVEISFHPGTEMGQATAEVVAMANRAMSRMPPGTLPPMVMRLDAGSVPVGFLVMEGKTTPIGMVADLAQNIIRPLVLQNVPGTVAVSPFGPNVRSIMIKCDPEKLEAYNLSPHDVTNALMAGNAVVPAGNLYIKDSMPMVPTNATVLDVHELGAIPLRLGENVYIRDVADDRGRHRSGFRRRAGERQEFGIPADHQKEHGLDPDGRRRHPKIDATVPRRRAQGRLRQFRVRRVAGGAGCGAQRRDRRADRRGLTGLMILLFLHDVRSVLVVVCNIPLALLGALLGLWVTGNTINIMSLGGLALSIGMLVDKSTVIIENLHVQMKDNDNVSTAMVYASRTTAVPILLALFCVLSVFVPAFIMQDPLAVAVHAADDGGGVRDDLGLSSFRSRLFR